MERSREVEKRINSAGVTAEDLQKATEHVHQLPPEGRNWQGRIHAMARAFMGEPEKALAVEYRLVAMSRMLEAGHLPGWATSKDADGAMTVAGPVWEAAAAEPLMFGEGEPYFDKARFLDRVLLLVEPEGNA